MKRQAVKALHKGIKAGYSKQFASIPKAAFVFDLDNSEYSASIAGKYQRGQGCTGVEKNRLKFAADIASGKKKLIPISPTSKLFASLHKDKEAANVARPAPEQATRESLSALEAKFAAEELKHAVLEAQKEGMKAAIYDMECAEQIEDIGACIRDLQQ